MPVPATTTSCNGGIACCTTVSPRQASRTTSPRTQAITGGERTSGCKSRCPGSARCFDTSDNFQRPYRRTTIGIEAMDLMLDLVVEPDRSWRWKDKHELETLVRRGM